MGRIDGHLFGAEDPGRSKVRRERREAAHRRNQARQANAGVCNCGNDPNCQICQGTGSVWI